MRKFDYAFLENAALPAQIVDNAIAIGRIQVKEGIQKKRMRFFARSPLAGAHIL